MKVAKPTTTEFRSDCLPDAPIAKRPRKYTGPAKGSHEAKERMAKVRAAQWAKNGLVVSNVSGVVEHYR